jgi:hypothetical protein
MRQEIIRDENKEEAKTKYLYLFFTNFVGFVVDYQPECEEI